VDARHEAGHDGAKSGRGNPRYVVFFEPAKVALTLSNSSTFTPLRRMM
jgi:hypothetical protein